MAAFPLLFRLTALKFGRQRRRAVFVAKRAPWALSPTQLGVFTGVAWSCIFTIRVVARSTFDVAAQSSCFPKRHFLRMVRSFSTSSPIGRCVFPFASAFQSGRRILLPILALHT